MNIPLCPKHNEKELKIGDVLHKYCVKCRKVWFLTDTVFTISNPNHSHLRNTKTWKEIKNRSKLKDFWFFIESIGENK